MVAFGGKPAVGVKNVSIASTHIYDIAYSQGAQTYQSSYSNSQANFFCINCRVKSRWSSTWYGPHCTNQGIGLDFGYQDQGTFGCLVSTGGFTTAADGGEIVDSIPMEFWDFEFVEPPSGGDAGTMEGDDDLDPDDYIVAPGNQFQLLYQQDGNLVIYDGSTPVWAIGITDNNPGRALMQTDGNFVVYDGNDQPVWATGTQGNSGAYLALLDNGMIVIFSSSGIPLWWSDNF